MPGTPLPITPVMQRSLRIRDLPHAGGDPVLAAERAEWSGARVRLLDPTEGTRKPACTVTVGTERFEITDHSSGRKASPRSFARAQLSLEDDLPACGWVDVPASLSDIEADSAKVVAAQRRREAAVLSSLGKGGVAGMLAALGAAFVVEKKHDADRTRLRDRYAERVAGR